MHFKKLLKQNNVSVNEKRRSESVTTSDLNQWTNTFMNAFNWPNASAFGCRQMLVTPNLQTSSQAMKLRCASYVTHEILMKNE